MISQTLLPSRKNEYDFLKIETNSATKKTRKQISSGHLKARQKRALTQQQVEGHSVKCQTGLGKLF